MVESLHGLFVKKADSLTATLEVLADRELSERLLKLSKTIDDDVAANRLLTTEDVFRQRGILPLKK